MEPQFEAQSKGELNTLGLAHRFMREHVKPGDFCIDATAGNGGDTALLCSLVGERGRVLAFDIQPAAVQRTQALLQQRGLQHIGHVVLDSHSNVARYAQPGEVACMVFNLGWLPGGDHSIFTRAQTSIEAIEKGLLLLKSGGVMCICIYYGGESGFEERDTLLRYLPTIDSRRYTVLLTQFYNRPNNPAIPVFLFKE